VRVDTELIEISKRRHLLIDRADVAGVMSSGQWARRLADGAWAPVAPGVWRHAATPVDWRLQARAGLRSLGREAALYGTTAAGWWGLGEIAVEDAEFAVPRTRKSKAFPFVLHSTRHWDPLDLTMHEGLRVTSASRTVVDLATGGYSAAHLERVIDQAVSRRLTSLPTLRSRIDALCGPGVTGSGLLRALLMDTGGDSFLERRFLELVRVHGFQRPTCQVVHRHDGKHITRVDFQFPGTNVIVEVSGRLGHVSDRDRQKDARRRNALQAAGHVVLEFTTADVLDGADYVLATLTEHIG
jgi:very-short-patch-repair endonuclease